MPKVKNVDDIPMSDFMEDAIESGVVSSAQVIKNGHIASDDDIVMDNLVKVINANSKLSKKVDNLTTRVENLERPLYKKLFKK